MHRQTVDCHVCTTCGMHYTANTSHLMPSTIQHNIQIGSTTYSMHIIQLMCTVATHDTVCMYVYNSAEAT